MRGDELRMDVTQIEKKRKQETSVFTDVVELKCQMNDLITIIRDLYMLLGENYFRLFGTKPEEEVAEICWQIQGKQKEMALIKRNIAQLNNCSDRLSDDRRRTIWKEKNFCPQCGTNVVAGMRFCSECGFKIV